LPPIPSLNLKAALGQKPQKHTSSSLIILKKSPAIIVTRNTTLTPELELRFKGFRVGFDPEELTTENTENTESTEGE
jgi:hypothetical protein